MSCCNGSAKAPTTGGQLRQDGPTTTYEVVQDYYGKVLGNTRDLKTSACTASGRPHAHIVAAIKMIPEEVMDKFYGCGAPLPLGIDGLRVLDLGSGSGRDSYACAQLVGEQGQVTGIDMTPEQIKVWQLYKLCSPPA